MHWLAPTSSRRNTSVTVSAPHPQQDELVQRYLPLVRKIAGSLYAIRSFDGVPFDEYLQFGAEGLLQAIHRYDPSVGAKFETYAQYRIKGAIMSGLEKSTEVNQQVVTLRRLAQERMASILTAEPSGADQPSPPITPFDRLVQASVGLAVAFMLEDSTLFRSGESTSWDDGASNLAYKQLQGRLKTAMDTLTEKERIVLDWHYYQHEPFETAARELGVTKGRVSQLHSSALQKLRKALAVNHIGELVG